MHIDVLFNEILFQEENKMNKQNTYYGTSIDLLAKNGYRETIDFLKENGFQVTCDKYSRIPHNLSLFPETYSLYTPIEKLKRRYNQKFKT